MKYLVKLFDKFFAPLNWDLMQGTLKEDLVPVRKNDKK